MGEKRHGWGWNWRKSPPHLALLTTFLLPRLPDEHPPLPNGLTWRAMLGEPPHVAVERFLVQGVLKRCEDQVALSMLTVETLKEILRTKGKKVSGRKEDLVARIIDAHIDVLCCSDYGRPLAEKYRENPEEAIEAGLTFDVYKEILKWVMLAAAGGIVENLAWNALKRLATDSVQDTPKSTDTTPTPSPKPAPTPNRVAQLVEEIRNGRKDLQGADLRGADLRGADLSNANLIRANLGITINPGGATAVQADFGIAEAKWIVTDLSLANLSGADLREADLTGVNLTQADLSGADLRGAKLHGADLTSASLNGAELANAYLPGAILPDGRPFTRFADLSKHTNL